MSKILMSINPVHVQNIINGTKKYEYRTKVAKKDVESIIIYSTFPDKKVVGEVLIKSIICKIPEELWQLTRKYSGISQDFFFSYFNGRKVAYAYELGEIEIFKEPKTLEDFGVKFAPQSYIYINL